jgi:hypothetical protein
MARNTKPDYKSVKCEFDVQKDFERTKPNLGLTPQQVAIISCTSAALRAIRELLSFIS